MSGNSSRGLHNSGCVYCEPLFNVYVLHNVCLCLHSTHEPKFKINQHHAAVKALSWCPWHRNVLASGGGTVCLISHVILYMVKNLVVELNSHEFRYR